MRFRSLLALTIFSSTKPSFFCLIRGRLPSSWPVMWVMAKKGVLVSIVSKRRLGPALPMTQSAAWI